MIKSGAIFGVIACIALLVTACTSQTGTDSTTTESGDAARSAQAEKVRNLEWIYNEKFGPMFEIQVGTSIDPFTHSTRAFVVPEGNLNYGRDVDQSLLLGRCGSSGSFGFDPQGAQYSIHFCAPVVIFKNKGWDGEVLDMYIFDSIHGYVFEGQKKIADIQMDHQSEEINKLKVYVPKIDDDWLVHSKYISEVHCSGEVECSAYIQTILPKIKEQQEAIDPKNIEWNQCKNMMEVVTTGGTCYRNSGEFKGRTCEDLVHAKDFMKYYDSTCCELYKEKFPNAIPLFKCK